MNKFVFSLLGLLVPLALQAEKLKLVNNYSNPIQVTIYNKDSNTPKEFRIDPSTPIGIVVGNLAQIERIDIKPYGDYKQYEQWGIKQIDLTEAQKLAKENPDKSIVIAITATNPLGGWLGGFGSGWGTWNYKTSVAQSGRDLPEQAKTLTDIFPSAVAAARAGQPIYTRYILNFPKDATPSEAEITKRYRERMLEFHPDKTRNQALSNQVAQIINAAKQAGPNGTIPANLFKSDAIDDLEASFISLGE